MAPDATQSSLFDFSAAFDLLDSFKYAPTASLSSSSDEASTDLGIRYPIRDPAKYTPSSTPPKSLGDFDRLWEFLRESTPSPDSTTSALYESSGSSLSDKYYTSQPSQQSTPPSSVLDEDEEPARQVRWTDQVEAGVNATVKRDPPSVAHEFKAVINTPVQLRQKATGSEIKNIADFESDVEQGNSIGARTKPLKTAKAKLLLPPIGPQLSRDQDALLPIDTLTKEEKRERLLRKLYQRFGHFVTPGMRDDPQYNSGSESLHVFVDCSNILIGFHDALKKRRGIDVRVRKKQAPFSWELFALLLERGRPAARRIVAGSKGNQRRKPPRYLLEAEECGYELNLMDLVFKARDTTPKSRARTGNGYATASGYSSSEGGPGLIPSFCEQGVDELLQMKMLESLVDYKKTPGTIVLATGDAAEAEFSGGFLKNVKRALADGWKVELVSWKKGMGQDYRSLSFLKQWKGRFSIIEMDDFSEDLLAYYTYSVDAEADGGAAAKQFSYLGFNDMI